MSTPVKATQPPPVPNWSLAETEDDEETMDLDDSSYVPGFSGMEESSIAESPRIPLKDVPKYIVYESCLLELFALCPSCNHKCTVKTFARGTFLSVKQNCLTCHLTKEWNSQPKVGSMVVGNLHLSAAIAFTGASFREVIKVLNALKVKAISETAHYKNVTTYLNPCIYNAWKIHQAELFHSLSQEEEVILGGDMRADSPGHSAKYGSYTMMDMQSGNIVDIQLVQSSEVGGSTHMEKGLIRSLNLLENSGVKISSIISDRHLQIQKFLREQKPEIKHFYDVWHVAKGLSKKLEALSKERDCGKVKNWRQSIINHMYWSATTSATGQEIDAKWTSLANHVQDVHTHSNVLFPQCQHAALTGGQSSKWFKPGTKVTGKLEKILLDTRLLKDIEKLSPHHQTSAIEGFHSLILKFAPKNLVFSFHGMLCRIC
ncbi:uncharacterized protein LOC115379929 [Myripristis murdjan]|uniref:uncharacterized protein LOC115379929 n=1 Tax=Myripristis murdjan TaxID=586833 RepID=UPI001175ED35|nr:uncharacterized protein LOC115379929 [Myripristis murdjan]